MRSKKKKLLFICFSALIMVGLCIGVFADYNDDRLGTYMTVAPYDIGESVYSASDTSSYHIDEGYYIVKFEFSDSDLSENNLIFISNETYSSLSLFYSRNYVAYLFYSINSSTDFNFIYLNEPGSYYCYCYFTDLDIYASTYIVNSSTCNFEIYTINDEYSIDIYDNSQDVWASVASIVDDATDSVINNDILLMFAAAIPVLSFGVGMLIRLVHKS